MKITRLLLIGLIAFQSLTGRAQSPPPYSYTMLHCDPNLNVPARWLPLMDIIHLADSFNVPMTIELAPQWVNLILADTAKIDTIRAWQQRGHEIAAHHHGIYHCYWDGYTNYPVPDIMAQQPNFPQAQCEQSLVYTDTMQPFYDKLDVIAGDSTMLTWGSSDDFPAVDLYPHTLYRTNGGRNMIDAFSNVITSTYGPTTLTNGTYGPYTVCEVGHAFIDTITHVDSIKLAYFNVGFSSAFQVVSANTHVYNFAADPTFLIEWFKFISDTAVTLGTQPMTVRNIMRTLNCNPLSVSKEFPNQLSATVFPNPFSAFATVELQNVTGKWTWTLYDPIGRTVQNIDNITNRRLVINKGDLMPGVYLYQVKTRGKLAATGKLTIK